MAKPVEKINTENYMFRRTGNAVVLSRKNDHGPLPKAMKEIMYGLGFKKTNSTSYYYTGEGDLEEVLLDAGFSPWERIEYLYYCPNCHYTISCNHRIDDKLLCTDCWTKLVPSRKKEENRGQT